MKLVVAAVVLSLLILSLPREGAATHLETCDCHEINDIVNATVQEAIAGLEEKLNILIAKSSEKTSTKLETTLSTTINRALELIKVQLDYHLPPPPGLTEDSPSESCKQIKQAYPNAESGYYWVTAGGDDSTPVRVYCNMSLTCDGLAGGWMKVADLDMRDTSQSCPSGFTYTSSPKRLCDITSTGACVGEEYSVHGIQYNHVCGRIIGYQRRVPVAYHHPFHSNSHYNNINQPYTYGVSLTHGSVNHRSHIWTFVGSSDESSRSGNLRFKCPCINTGITVPNAPAFMGNDYFCDTAISVYYTSSSTWSNNAVDTSDPLWDGEGCGPTNSCCNFPSSSVKPPWFYKHLSQATTDDIEMRLCRPSGDGSTPIEIVELYIQ